MWEVKFDNGETHALAASWIVLKLWSKSVEDEWDDEDNDEDEDSSEQASSKDDNEDQENEKEEEEAENTAGTAANDETDTQASSSDKEQASGTQRRQVTCGNCGAVVHNRASCKEQPQEGGTMPRLRKRSRRPALSFLKAVQVRYAAIGCLRARTVRLRELLQCCKFTTHV